MAGFSAKISPAGPILGGTDFGVTGRKNWSPSEYTWICSELFVSGAKSNNPLALNYVPTLFKHVDSPIKRKLEGRVQGFERRQSVKRRRVEEAERERLDKEAEIQLQLKEQEEKKKLEEEAAARKRLEEIELERQRQEALLKHHEMILENKRKQKETEEQRNESMVRERSKLIHDMQKISEAHDGLLV